MEKKTNINIDCGIITLVFIILKLCNVITWSWIWVLAPLWITFAVIIISLITIIVLAKIGE